MLYTQSISLSKMGSSMQSNETKIGNIMSCYVYFTHLVLTFNKTGSKYNSYMIIDIINEVKLVNVLTCHFLATMMVETNLWYLRSLI